MDTVRRWIVKLCLAELLIAAALFHGSRLLAQSQETINERVSIQQFVLEKRVDKLESIEAEARLRGLESDMGEVKWLGRTVALAVIGQLVLAALSMRQHSQRPDGEPD